MRMSKMFSRTLHEAPASCETKGYAMLVRAGFIKQLGAGIFDILPLGLRSVRKIENILREEINAIGGQEVQLPVVNPADIWRKTGRFDSIGSEMTRLKDRNNRDLVLAMTHEEAMTELGLFEIDSYKKLPQLIYQIQTKWRDDPRPRAGLIRVREFTMKDSYSFDKDYEGLKKQYDAHYDAYFRIFKRMGLPCIAVASDSGMMGGKVAHEYMYLSEIGEDTIIICEKCGYTANKQVAKFDKSLAKSPADKEEAELKKVKTPETKTISDLCDLLKIKPEETAKAVFFTGIYPGEKEGEKKEKLIACMIRGDLDVEENKVLNTAKALDMRNATEDEIRKCGMEPGFASLIGAKGEFVGIMDDSLAGMKSFCTGANKKDYHYLNASADRDFKSAVVADISACKAGCKCPECGHELISSRGVEIGNIFQLGTRYSDSFGLSYQDENGEKKSVVMGSYGIGVGRSLACLAQEYSDDKGLKLPISVAPYQVQLVSLLKDNAPADEIYEQLVAAGIEVLYDDRNENAGVKFFDSELIGCPIILKFGNKGLKNGICEVSLRKSLDKHEEIPLDKLVQTVSILIRQCFEPLKAV
ncbi:MAG TPA: proline--tRNA ligase [Spirochaetaceae bacterium]|nr:proline--tRNA ligase [Spirochaetaceae bacterium]